MRLNMKRNIALLLLCIAFLSCENHDNLFCGRLIAVKGFNHEYRLKGVVEEAIDTIGTFQVNFSTSYLITTLYKSPYFAKLYDDKTLQCFGDFACRGDGPSEFLDFSILNQQQDSVLWVQDYQKKKLYGIDLAKSVAQKSIVLRTEFGYTQMVDPLQVFYCCDSLLLIKNMEYGKGLQYAKFNPSFPDKEAERIYMYNSVLSQQDLNLIMSLSDCLKPDSKMIASLTGVMNQIDLLNLEDSAKSLSVRVGDGPTTLEDIRQNIESLHDYYISLPRCNNDLIFALYCHKDDSKKKEFHVISWEGDALFKLLVDEDLRDFNVDWGKGKLYGITTDDIVYVYDVTDVLMAL